MPESQKDKNDGTVEEDQKELGYYYDDAHGYEEYDPEAEEEENTVTRGRGDAEKEGRDGKI